MCVSVHTILAGRSTVTRQNEVFRHSLGSLQSRRRLPFQLGDHAGGDRQAKQIGGNLLDLPLAKAISPRQHGQDGLEVGAEAAVGNTVGQNAARVAPESGELCDDQVVLPASYNWPERAVSA